jgi:hypothetical protein
MRAVVVIFVLMASSGAFAASEGIPEVDVGAVCSQHFQNKREMINYCVEKNQTSYDYLKLFEWARASREARQKCLPQMAQASGGYSPFAYYYLEACINSWRPVDEANRLRNGTSVFQP